MKITKVALEGAQLIARVWRWIKAEANRPMREPFGLPAEYYEKRRAQARLEEIESRLSALEGRTQ